MASRVAGALLALTAAALLAVSVVMTAWWSGHPSFNGAEIHSKEITVGPLGATGCNVGGDGSCMNVPVDPTFETVGFALSGASGLLLITMLALTFFLLQNSPRMRSFGVFTLVGAVIALLLAGALVLIGPQIRTETALPMTSGIFIFFGAIAAAFIGGTLALRAPVPSSRMQLAPARQSMHLIPQSPGGGLDVHALLAEDALRPSSLGPEPKMGRHASPGVQSPGGMLPGPSGPLGAVGPSGAQPLFTSAPNLRPLYDVAPGQGGTGGFVPQSPPHNFPTRPPTPMPRDQIAALTGLPTPAAPMDVVPPIAGTPSPIPPDTDRDLLGTRKSLPPPVRGASVAPIPSLAPPKQTALGVMPPLPDLRDDSGEFDAMKTYQVEQKKPEPKRETKSQPPLPKPPLKRPPSAADQPTVPLTKPQRVETQSREPTKPRAATPRPPTRLATEDPEPNTDVGNAPLPETFETPTNESTNFAQTPRPPTNTSTVQTQAAPDTQDDDDVMTHGRDKIAPTDVVPVRPPTDTAPSPLVKSDEPPPTAEQPIPSFEMAQPADEGPTDREKAKFPISTAPDSLPPPSEKQQATSGPSPACPQCEAPMAWVEAHLRFYCKSCKMYF